MCPVVQRAALCPGILAFSREGEKGQEAALCPLILAFSREGRRDKTPPRWDPAGVI